MKRDPVFFTKREAIARLQAAKSLLAIRERVAFGRTGCTLGILGYDPEAEESFYKAPPLGEGAISWLGDCALAAEDAGRWESPSSASPASQFVGSNFYGRVPIGEVVKLLFFAWGKSSATKAAALWLGTWHHAPIVACCNAGKLTVQSLPAYSDLIS